MRSFQTFAILNALDSLENAYSMSDELRKLEEIKRNLETVLPQNGDKTKDKSYSEVKETDETGIAIPCYAAPGETEAQSSRECAQGIECNADTQDMDDSFGIKDLVQHLTESEFDLELVLKGMDVTMDQFMDIYILYGPNRALEFIKEWEKIESLIRNNPKYKKARELFQDSNVKDCNKEMIEWNLFGDECMEDVSERGVLNCDYLDNIDYNADDDHCDNCLFQKTANQLLFILNNNYKQSSSSLFDIVADGFMNDLKDI